MPGQLNRAQWLASLPRKPMGAGVRFTDPDGRVLLVEPNYRDEWGLPGGVVEAGESPRVAARRETLEELGLDVVPQQLLVVDYAPPRPDGGDSLNWVFDGGAVNDAEIVLQDEELLSWAWCTPAEIAARAGAQTTRRLAAAVVAAEQGSTLYLEDSRRPA